MGKICPICSLVFTHFIISCGVWLQCGCGWEQKEAAAASCAGGDRSVWIPGTCSLFYEMLPVDV